MSSLPERLSLENYIKYIPSQENIDCCTASATLLAAETIMSMSGKNIVFSRLFLYYVTRVIQNRIGQRGAELKSTLEALSQFGVSTERTWPFVQQRIDKLPHQPAYQEALNYKVNSYESVCVDQYKDYLSMGIPIIVGMFTGRRFWSLKGSLETQNYLPINNDTNRLYKGHAVLCVGYDDNINGGSWIVANSLGLRWGDHGYGAIPYACNNELAESYVITKFAGIPAGKKFL